MTVNQYKDLDEAEQLEIVWLSEFLAQKSEDGFLYELYYYQNLFIEVQSSITTKQYIKFTPMLEGWN